MEKLILDEQVTIISDEDDSVLDKKQFLARIEQSITDKKTTVTHDNGSWYDNQGFAFLNRKFS